MPVSKAIRSNANQGCGLLLKKPIPSAKRNYPLATGPTSLCMTMHYNAKGIVYISFEWFFTFVQILIVTLRIYSRIFLTRSVGSDDFFIVIAFVCSIVVFATIS